MSDRELPFYGLAPGGLLAQCPRAIYLSLFFVLFGTFFVVAPAQVQAAGHLTVSSSAVQFGDVKVGESQFIQITLRNSGNASLVLSGHAVNGTGFSTSGVSFPATLHAGATAVLDVKFAPVKVGDVSGRIRLFTKEANDTVDIALKGAGVAGSEKPSVGDLTVSSSALNFGNVRVGQSTILKVTLKNSGNSSLILSGDSVSGAGFSTSGVSFPTTLHTGATAVLDVKFLPAKTGSVSGSVQLFTKGANGTVDIRLKGTGATSQAAGYLNATPLMAQFPTVPVGTQNTESIELTNTGSEGLTISSVKTTGTGFSVSGLATPLSIPAGGKANFTVGFLPAAVGSLTGSVVLSSTASDSQMTILLSGTGVADSRVLAVSPASLAFGSVNVNGSAIQQITLKNAGNSNLTITGGSVTGTGFSIAGLSAGTTLVPGQTAVLSVEYSPTAVGASSGAITIKDNATNGGSFTIPLTGTGVAAALSVILQWQPSKSSDVVGYYVYRSTVSGGPYEVLFGTPIAATKFTDTNVSSGTAYYYVVTATAATGTQSAYSTQIGVTLP